jgi:hypothetical protein
VGGGGRGEDKSIIKAALIYSLNNFFCISI